jgi:hypothetical protein
MIPRYGEWDATYRAAGLEVIGIHAPETEGEADPAALAAFVRRERIRWTVVLDPAHDAWRRFGVRAWPTALLVDRRGIVREAFVGDDSAPEIQRTLVRLLAER